MKNTGCPFESEVMAALQRGALTPELEKHIKFCPLCRDVRRVHSWMNLYEKRSVQGEGIPRPVPNFATIWENAGNYRGFEKELEKRALAPLMIPRILLTILVFVGIGLLVATGFGEVKHFVIGELRMGFMADVLMLIGKKMVALLPLLGIPLISMLLGGLGYLIYTRFHPKRIKSG